jgi:hypothetical protein
MQIAEDIFFGKVWHNLPWKNQTEFKGDKFYFINRPDFGFVGVVEAFDADLHAYLKPRLRGFGIMSGALKDTILPHTFWYNKADEQRITIDKTLQGNNFEKVQQSALLAGFKLKSVLADSLYEYIAFKNDFAEFKFREKDNKFISEKEFHFLHNRINSINAQLQYMKERYEILFNEDDAIVSSLLKATEQFESLYDNKIRTLL